MGKEKDSALSFKKAEEKIAFGLKLLQKCLRGAAEVLGDEHSTGTLLSFPALQRKSSEMDVDSDHDAVTVTPGEEDASSLLVIRTARERTLSLLQQHSKEDKQLYANLRYTILEFLIYCNGSLQALLPSLSSSSQSSADGAGAYSGLCDSHVIQVRHGSASTHDVDP